MQIKLWARQQGISVRTAYRRFHAGTLGVPAHQLANKRIVVDLDAEHCRGACLQLLHVSCLADAVLDELRRRGYRLDVDPSGAAP